jgi:hypothetical protein
MVRRAYRASHRVVRRRQRGEAGAASRARAAAWRWRPPRLRAGRHPSGRGCVGQSEGVPPLASPGGGRHGDRHQWAHETPCARRAAHALCAVLWLCGARSLGASRSQGRRRHVRAVLRGWHGGARVRQGQGRALQRGAGASGGVPSRGDALRQDGRRRLAGQPGARPRIRARGVDGAAAWAHCAASRAARAQPCRVRCRVTV